jgi:hypothetical protein
MFDYRRAGLLGKEKIVLRKYLLTGLSGYIIMELVEIRYKSTAEVTGAWWCSWSSKPVRGL